MESLSSISGIGKNSLELLEAAGFDSVDTLSKAGVEDLAAELKRANSMLKISKRSPGVSQVEAWIKEARLRIGEVEEEPAGEEPADREDSADDRVRPVNYEESGEVAPLLAVAPFAIPLPARLLMENQLAVSDIPSAILLNRYSGDLDVRVEERLPTRNRQAGPVSSGAVKLADEPRAQQQRLEIDTSKVRTMDSLGTPLLKSPSVKVSPANDRVALLRAPRSSTNKGRSPDSRWYIRGVLHSHPVSVYIGALVTLLLMFMVPLALVAAALLLLSREVPDQFEWVPPWVIAFPIALPVLGIAYLLWGISSSCRICGQKLFTHRRHLKNIKAHQIKGLGYILPLCFQILIFRWFRCTHCGTPVRLKE